jgi:hypothetical protein
MVTTQKLILVTNQILIMPLLNARMRGSEQAAEFFDTETGEYCAPPVSLPKANKESANVWVTCKLSQLVTLQAQDRQKIRH